MSNLTISVVIGVVIWLAVFFNSFMFIQVIAGIFRSQWNRVDRELREILTGKQNFLVPRDG